MDRQLIKGTALGVLTGAGVGLLCFELAENRIAQSMGLAMFFLAPAAAGFAMALVIGRKSLLVSGCLSVLVCLTVLIATKAEGLLCAILAFPLIGGSFAAGCSLGLLARLFLRQRKTQAGALALLPVIVVGGRVAEEPWVRSPRLEVVSTSLVVKSAPESVWDAIQTFDALRGAKPWLMYVGLPEPVRCTMVGRGVGARRSCFFDKGKIEETITEWQPPFRLAMRIDRTNMPGRHWMDFAGADYELRPAQQGTLLTRVTVLTSRLSPEWYWRPLERMGVEAEHRYIFENVTSKLNP
ncbi:MAG: SRPBCC family protein [Acidobacteria bacterium]|nr:SRPBCC family protein [Acidobacteriota bacterium]